MCILLYNIPDSNTNWLYNKYKNKNIAQFIKYNKNMAFYFMMRSFFLSYENNGVLLRATFSAWNWANDLNSLKGK